MTPDSLRRELVGMLPRLRRFAYGLTGSMHDADDLLQATAERVLERGMPPDAAADRWMFRVCRNIWIDELRSRRTRSAVSLDAAPEPGEAIDGERVVIGKLALEDVSKALGRLPEEQRSALLLVVLEGCTYAEAAAILGTPIGTVMSRIARARAALSMPPAERSDPASARAGAKR
jgi:RNA polymerase sigma-70 factor (ECF subfamily)